jgi:hypothetical protein
MVFSADCPHTPAVDTSLGGRKVGTRPQFIVASTILANSGGEAAVVTLLRRRLTLAVEDTYVDDAEVDAAEVACRRDEIRTLVSCRSCGGTLGERHLGRVLVFLSR